MRLPLLPERDLFRTNDTQVLIALTRLGTNVTVREVVRATGIPLTTVYDSLRWLREHGLVEWEEGRHATLRSRMVEVPLPRPRRRRSR